jgi:hypothetical protein
MPFRQDGGLQIQCEREIMIATVAVAVAVEIGIII